MTLQWVHELQIHSNQLRKFKGLLAGEAKSEGHTKIAKTLCQTRWTVHRQAVDTVLSQYEAVLSSLEEKALIGSSSGKGK